MAELKGKKRRTRIICTIGPAVDVRSRLKRLMRQGFDVARLNFSHGSHEEHRERIALIRQLNLELGCNTAILLDTKGPEIRTGEGEAFLKKGREVMITVRGEPTTPEGFSVSYRNLPREVSPGDRILLDDGLISLEVLETKSFSIRCRVENSGSLGSKKGVNIPGVKIRLPGISEKDRQDLLFGVAEDVDFIALSFVRSPRDIREARKILGESGKGIQIIAKIENRQGVEEIDGILEEADGIMIARGDLGVEIPIKELPGVQKSIIRKARMAAKPVIVATQMLDSMMRNPRPTRAEVSDIANSILDGTDAIMLSGETASGKYPHESLKIMDEIAREIEGELPSLEPMHFKKLKKAESRVDLITYSAADMGKRLGACALLIPSNSGRTVRRVSRYRPSIPIIALVDNERLTRQLMLVWGVESINLAGGYSGTDELIKRGEEELLKRKLCRKGDLIVVTAGIPIKTAGTTNMIKIQCIGGE